MMRALVLTTALIASIAPATAQVAQRGNEDLQLNCASDALTFCIGIDPNSRQMDACFERNLSKMSPNCRRSIEAYKAAGGK